MITDIERFILQNIKQKIITGTHLRITNVILNLRYETNGYKRFSHG